MMMLLSSILVGMWIFSGCCVVAPNVSARTTAMVVMINVICSIISLIVVGAYSYLH